MADQRLARRVNELAILTALRALGPTSRADLARRLDVTPATASRIVADMAARGLLRESRDGPAPGRAREPGRPGVAVEIDPRGAHFLGVEIGVGVVRYALLDLAADVVASAEERVDPAAQPAAVVRAIARRTDALARDRRFRGRIRSIGVTVPGLVTLDGHVVHLPILGWRDLDLREALDDAAGLPCFVENNATAAAFGAVYVETSMPRACTIFLKLGAGCGGAAVVNGRVLRGAAGTAGEFGHLRIAAGGPRCYCGQRGCLETFVNVAALSRAYAGRECTTADLDDLPTAVAQALLGGDRRARRAADALCRRLGEGLVALVNVFNPSTIVLGGPMRPLLEPLLPRLSAAVAAGIVSGTVVPDVRLSTTGLLECAVGAAAVAHHHYFDVPALDPARRETAP